MGSISRAYLIAYNAAMAAGWAAVLWGVAGSGGAADAFARSRAALRVFQTGALLEVAHAASGLVRAPVATTLLQVFSRLLLVWGVLETAPPVRAHAAVVSMLAAWALTEIPRYAYFVCALARGAAPYWLTWLRYSTFIPLYPIGAGSEAVLLYRALPYVRRVGMYSLAMPNWANFAFDYYTFCLVCLATYVPGLPHMFSHMVRQRSKNLAKAKTVAKSTSARESDTVSSASKVE